MSTLKTLRAKKKTLLSEFNLQKKMEWAQVSSELDARIQLEVNKLYKDGWRVAAIMREYGTSDRKTISDMLFKTPETPPASVFAAALTFEHREGDTYVVTDGTNEATVVAIVEDRELIVTNTTDPAFGASIDYAQLEASGVMQLAP